MEVEGSEGEEEVEVEAPSPTLLEPETTLTVEEGVGHIIAHSSKPIDQTNVPKTRQPRQHAKPSRRRSL